MKTATLEKQEVVTVNNLERVCEQAFWALKAIPLPEPGDMPTENARLAAVEKIRVVKATLARLWSAKELGKLFRERLAPLYPARDRYVEARAKLEAELGQAQARFERTKAPRDGEIVALYEKSLEALDFGCNMNGVLDLPSPLELAMPGVDFRKERPFRAVESRIRELELQLDETLDRVMPVLRELGY